MHPNFQTTAYPRHRGGADRSVITRALRGPSFLRAQPHLSVGRIMAAEMKSFVANRFLLQYCTDTEILVFYAQSLALETNNSHTRDSMSTKWRSQ